MATSAEAPAEAPANAAAAVFTQSLATPPAAAASGQLTEAEWQVAMVLFCQWWRQACPQHPPWVLQDAVMPVTQQVVHFLQLERPVVAADRAPPSCGSSNITLAQEAGLTASTVPAAADQPVSPAGDALPVRSSGGLHTASATMLCAGAATVAAAAEGVPGSSHGSRTGLCHQQLGLDIPQTPAAVGGDSSQMAAAVGVDTTPAAVDDDALECFDEATLPQPRPACSGGARPLTELQQQQQVWQQCHMHKHSVVWHDIYRVPVLYLAACRADGCPLSLAQLCEDLPQLADYQEAGQASWTFLTATAHPVTAAPCFMLHPCQTAARMQLLMQAAAEGAPGTSTAGAAALSAAAATASSSATAVAADLAAASVGVDSEGQPPVRAGLLTYVRGWFSMVVPLLGLSMLQDRQ